MNTELEIPHNLKEAIRDKKILVFIGAGVSKAVGLPLWKDIVIKTLKDPSIAKGEKFISAIEDELLTPLEVLDKIQESNRKEVYKHFEEETSKLAKHEIYSSIASISKRIITTNYDGLIEHNSSIRRIDTSSTFNLQKIDDSDEFILKIHGDCSAIDNAVIFTSDYEKLYGSDDGLAKFQLEKLVSSYTCLFVGFSMSDNYVVELFDRLNNIYKGLGRDHFIISTTQVNHEFVETIKLDSHDQILPLLKDLASFNSDLEKTEPSTAADTAKIDLPSHQESPGNLLPEDGIKIHIGRDTPPKIEHWTGRSEELKSLTAPHKVCFITGIGGQGKSALASKLLSEADRDNHKFCDWRDFKEEDLNFQSKLFQLIEFVSHDSIQTRQLVGLETEDLVDIFFNTLGDQRGVFVFDNIDKYIDLEKFTPTGDMETFFNKALKSPHNSKFIFTCRPFIHFAGIGFYQVRLVGLDFKDTKEFIKKYHNNINERDLNEIATRLHVATKGHPLWMGLVLAQSRTDINQMDFILKKIEAHHGHEAEDNISSIISETILKNVWSELKEREKIILRTLSISNITETEEDLAKIVSKKLKYNQFTKALKALKALSLIVTKEGSGHIELHPLVREFIKVNYGREEQESYIALYVSYLDGFIVLLKNKLGKILGSEDIDLLIKKIEILISSDKIQESINELRKTSDSFQISGYCEEYLRLADLLLSKNIWTRNKINNLHGFLDFTNTFFVRAADFGSYQLFDNYIDKYMSVFNTPDTHMILAKAAICHKEWSAGNYADAIKEGKSASDLIDMLGEADIYHGKHRYNLALRDSKIRENVEKALTYFCENQTTEELLAEDPSPAMSSKYGNIGRCLLYLDKVDSSLFLTAKSYKSLNEDNVNFFNRHNLGYAAKWIGEILLLQKSIQSSLYFMLHARNLWRNDMPGEANKIDSLILQMPETLSNQSITSLESWQIKKFCDDWINDYHDEYMRKNLNN